MKRPALFFLALMLFAAPRVKASHIFGCDLLYTHITGNTYKITLVLYGDCAGASSLINDLYIGAPDIYIYDGGSAFTTLRLAVESDAGQEVSPVCAAQKDSTSCSFGTLPGIRKFSYSNTVTLPDTSDEWKFIYKGSISSSSAGRSGNITNVFDVGNQVIYLVATLNNVNGPNSSPIYTTVPTPFYCVNVSQEYNQGATDTDQDSLLFEMVPGLTNGAPVTYVNPFSAELPLSAPDFNFNSLNGQMSFTPDILQKALVVNRVSEYKNGVLVGTSMREMTFIVIPCQNIPPDGDLSTNGSNITGGIHEGNNIINACKSTSTTVSFHIGPDDDNLHNVKVRAFNLPAGATLNISGDNTKTPSLDFSWNIASVPPGIYTFYINYTDDGCPLTSNKTIAYTIRIIDPYGITVEVIKDTACQPKAHVHITMSDGISPRTVVLLQGGDTIKTYTDDAGAIDDSLAAGTYTITVSNPNLPCDASISFTITSDGLTPNAPTLADSFVYCQYDLPEPFTPGNVTGSIQWYDLNGSQLTDVPAINTDLPGIYTWYLNQQQGVCGSAKKRVDVVVNDRPDVDILIKEEKICYADKVYLLAAGAAQYMWKPENSIKKETDGRMYMRITDSTTIVVVGIDTLGCRDTASVSLTQIEQCCKFSYPNAFTPNGDGKNDRFRPVMYGNMADFELFIYNRYGELVLHTSDPVSGWDGYYKGKICDVGMYYFRVRAKCYTGHAEEHADAVELLR